MAKRNHPMGKRQRDCVDCGAPVGFLDRQHCCLCVHLMREDVAKSACPDCGKQRVLQADTGASCAPDAAPNAHHPVRSASTTLRKACGRKADLLAAQRQCPRCGRSG
ncbi:MAG: hypothetical protein JO285_13145 [Kutzneria sp.]|nr:hypothetical protein [Kutzneria sp.]